MATIHTLRPGVATPEAVRRAQAKLALREQQTAIAARTAADAAEAETEARAELDQLLGRTG